MALLATATLICDECSETVEPDLERTETPDDAVDAEGWSYGGRMMERLLCPDCAEKQEDEDD